MLKMNFYLFNLVSNLNGVIRMRFYQRLRRVQAQVDVAGWGQVPDQDDWTLQAEVQQLRGKSLLQKKLNKKVEYLI
jgi:hypothetical protein